MSNAAFRFCIDTKYRNARGAPQNYNERRPPSALNGLTPAEFAEPPPLLEPLHHFSHTKGTENWGLAIGRKRAKIRIVNLHYERTVEAEVYMALCRRINLFEGVVRRLQPILGKLSGVISGHVLARHSGDPEARSALPDELERQAVAAEQEDFDLGAMLKGDLQESPCPSANLAFAEHDMILHRVHALPPGLEVNKAPRWRIRLLSPR